MADSGSLTKVVCFANAQLPDTDYRVSFAKSSDRFEVTLALPEKPAGLDSGSFELIGVGAGLPVRSIVQMLKIPTILLRRDADYALFFATQFSTLGPALARIVGATPLITITGMGRAFATSGTRAAIWKWLYRLAFRMNVRMSRAALFQNVEDMEMLSSRLPTRLAKRCVLIGSGIDLDYFDLEPAPTRRQDRVLMVARLLPEKGISDFLQLAAHYTSAEFVLIGPASDEHPGVVENVRTAVEREELSYLGRQSSEEVREQLRNAAVLVLPSHSEGLPRVALEAALSGVAVAAYDIPGCRAALGPDHPLIPFGDVMALGRQVEQLLSDEPLRRTVVEQSRAFVVEHLSSRAYIKRLEGLLS